MQGNIILLFIAREHDFQIKQHGCTHHLNIKIRFCCFPSKHDISAHFLHNLAEDKATNRNVIPHTHTLCTILDIVVEINYTTRLRLYMVVVYMTSVVCSLFGLYCTTALLK